MKPIPYGKQHITEDDIRAVVTTLQSDYLTQGPAIKEFEIAFANYVGCKFAVAVANGTAALHLCTLCLGVKSGDKVITTPITFVASANCVRYCGAEVVFADINPETYLLDFNHVKSLLSSSPRGTYQGIIPVDFAGKAVEMEAFRELANEYGLWLIEDACHAPGGYFTDRKGQKQKCGNGNFAELAIFSFHPVKHIASGEGGMITTNDEQMYQKLLLLRTHGITRDMNLFKNDTDFANGKINTATNQKNEEGHTTKCNYPGWYMEMQELGFNYRLSDIQAALGLSQLKRADLGILRRREIAKVYDQAFKDHPFIYSQLNELKDSPSGHAYHLYLIQVDDRLGLYNYLRKHNIFTQVHYIPIHLMPYYRQQGWKEGDMPYAEKYYSRCLSLPIYPSLSFEELNYIIEKVKAFF